MQVKAISWRRAAVAGLLYAILMSAWVYYDRGPGFDELAIRFAVYFAVFTVGFRLLMNFVARRNAPDG